MSSRGSSSASVPPLEIGRQRSPSPSARKQKSSPRDSSGLRKQVLSGSSNTGMHSRGLSSGSRPSLVESLDEWASYCTDHFLNQLYSPRRESVDDHASAETLTKSVNCRDFVERFYSSPHHRRRWKHLVAVAPGIVAPLPSPREESSSSHPGPPGGGLSRVNGFIDVASAMKVPPSLEDKKITPSSHVRVSQPPPLAPLQPADFHAIARLGKGGFGDVWLCRYLPHVPSFLAPPIDKPWEGSATDELLEDEQSGELLAVKRLKKSSNLMQRQEIERVLFERKVMLMGTSQRRKPSVSSPTGSPIRQKKKKDKKDKKGKRPDSCASEDGHVVVEIDQLGGCRWLASLRCCFQDDVYLYMGMEYLPGGDLGTLLEELGGMEEEDIKFYFAEMVESVRALHSLCICHRDLKPPNFMFDREGHIRLIDFGLSTETKIQSFRDTMGRKMGNRKKGGVGGSYTMNPRQWERRRKMCKSCVGSPEYIAPEVLCNEGYSEKVDLWSLGAILYEMFAGITPFAGSSLDEIFSNINQWSSVIERPCVVLEDDEEKLVSLCSDQAWDLISRLLCDEKDRISFTEMRTHPFFDSIRWELLLMQNPPFTPNLKDESDLSYFSGVLMAQHPHTTLQLLRDSLPKTSAAATKVKGFTYNPHKAKAHWKSTLHRNQLLRIMQGAEATEEQPKKSEKKHRRARSGGGDGGGEASEMSHFAQSPYNQSKKTGKQRPQLQSIFKQ